MQPKLKSKVLCTDREVGEVTRVIVDPLSQEVSHIVVGGDGMGPIERQVPMGQATRRVLEAMDTIVQVPKDEKDIAPTVNAALRLAYNSYASVAVLIPQRIIGIKSFQDQSAK